LGQNHDIMKLGSWGQITISVWREILADLRGSSLCLSWGENHYAFPGRGSLTDLERSSLCLSWGRIACRSWEGIPMYFLGEIHLHNSQFKRGESTFVNVNSLFTFIFTPGLHFHFYSSLHFHFPPSLHFHFPPRSSLLFSPQSSLIF
jgi:hypothetical protein